MHPRTHPRIRGTREPADLRPVPVCTVRRSLGTGYPRDDPRNESDGGDERSCTHPRTRPAAQRYDRIVIGVAYAIAAACCAVAWRGIRSCQQPNQRERGSIIWMVTSIVLGAMAIARSTDAAILGADAARRFAVTTRWYDNRRPIQLAALIALVVIWASAAALVVRRSRRNPPNPFAAKTAIVITLLLALAAIRAVSLHAADSLLSGSTLFTVEVGDLLELALLAGIVVLSIRSVTAPPLPTVGPAP